MDPPWGRLYPHLARTRAYVASLPNGLDSYPECRGKGSIWKSILKATDTSGLADRVPEELFIFTPGALFDAAWVPMVQNCAAHLVLRDCLFPTDDAQAEHFRTVDRGLFLGPLYRILLAVASPDMVVRAADLRFGALYQGMHVNVRTLGHGRVEVTQTYPPGLLPQLVSRMFMIGFEVAAEVARGKNVKGKQLEHGDTMARYEISWE